MHLYYGCIYICLTVGNALNLVTCNTLFRKQEAKLVTYVAGSVKSTVDYIMVRQKDKAKVRNIKVISSEECVPKHKLLGSRNADGSRILEFADGLNLVICNTLFTMQEAKLVTYVAGPVKSTVDYIINTKNCSLSLVLTATDQKPQKSLKR